MVPIAPWAIFGIVFNAGQGHGAAGLPHRPRRDDLHRAVLRADVEGVPDRRLGLLLRRARPHPALGFFAGWTILLDYLLVPTLLYVFAAESMAGIFPGVPKRVVDRAVPGHQHRRQLRRHLVHGGRQPALPGRRAALPRHLRCHGRSSRSATGSAARTSPPSRCSTPATSLRGLAATALSIAVLSFLGFDGIATLSEEAKGGRRAAGIAMITGLVLVAAFFVTQTWLAAMLVPDTTSFSDAEVNNAFFGIVRADQQPRLGGGLPRHERPGRRHRQRRGRPERHLPAAVLDEPRRTAAPVPGPHRHQNPGAGARDPAGRRADPGARAGLRRPDRHHLLAGQLRRADQLPAAAPVGDRPTTASSSASKNIFLHWISPVLGFLIIGYVLWNAERGGQDRRRHLARRRRPRARLLHLAGAPASWPSTPPCPSTPTPSPTPARRHAHDRPPARPRTRPPPGSPPSTRPALRITPGTGERITFETDDLAYAQMEELRDLSKVTATMNPVTGPVHVEGAEPGDALAVTIHDIELPEQGWSVYIPGAGALSGPMGAELVRPADPHPRRTGAPHRRPDLPGRPHDRLHRRGPCRR